MNRHDAKAGTDIFVRRAEKKQQVLAGQVPVKNKSNFGPFFKSACVFASMVILFVGINLSPAGIKEVEKQIADHASTLPAGTTLRDMVHQVEEPAFTPVQVAQVQPVTVEPAVNTPPFVPTTGGGFVTTPTFNTPTFNGPFVNPVQNTPGVPTGGVADISGAANQINQLNAQIAQQMQACLQLTAQAQGQVGQLRAQQQQLDNAIRQVNAQFSNVDYRDPNAQTYRYQIQAQRDQLQFQRNQINSALTQVRSQYSSARNACQSQVTRLQGAKRTMESQLSNAFSRAMSVSVY